MVPVPPLPRVWGRGDHHVSSNALRELVGHHRRVERTVTLVERVVAQTRIRLGSGVPDGSTRVVSLHDADARPIAKGRLGKPVEFGYKAQVDNGRQMGVPNLSPAQRYGHCCIYVRAARTHLHLCPSIPGAYIPMAMDDLDRQAERMILRERAMEVLEKTPPDTGATTLGELAEHWTEEQSAIVGEYLVGDQRRLRERILTKLDAQFAWGPRNVRPVVKVLAAIEEALCEGPLEEQIHLRDALYGAQQDLLGFRDEIDAAWAP